MTDFESIYLLYSDISQELLQSDRTFDKLKKIVGAGTSQITFVTKESQKSIEKDWIEMIESLLPYVDKYIRNPNRFIEEKDEILPISLAKSITNESIKHLGQHTNLIESVEDGYIRPSKILNVTKEESFNTYENRFIKTLLNRLFIFVNSRYDKIEEALRTEDSKSLVIEKNINVNDNDHVEIRLEINAKQRAETGNELRFQEFTKIKKIKTIIDTYQASDFMDKTKDCSYVRPPISRTNALMKNADLRECLKLWLYIENYDKVGYSVSFADTFAEISKEYIDDLDTMLTMQYSMFKHYIDPHEELELRRIYRKKALVPKFVKQFYDDMVEDFDVSQTEFIKYFDEAKLTLKDKRQKDVIKIRKAVAKALRIEASYRKMLKQKELERIEKEKERLAELKKAQQKQKAEQERKLALQKARLLREKLLKAERLQKEKAAKIAKIQKEKEAARQKKLLELQKQKLAKQKELEKQKLAKQKAKEALRKKVAAQKQRELLKLKAKKEAERKKAQALKLREQEKLKAQSQTKKVKRTKDSTALEKQLVDEQK